jgi:hypothetical protein
MRQHALLTTALLCLCFCQRALANAALWNDVLANSCPFEFDPAASTATAAEAQYIGMWVGHEYDASNLREADFTTEKVSAFSTQPWAEAVACGKMVQHSSLSAGCQSLIRAVRICGLHNRTFAAQSLGHAVHQRS